MWGVVTLQSVHGKFMCAEGGGGRELVANRDSVGDWEMFRFHCFDGYDKLVLQPGVRIVLRASSRQFVYADGGGGGRLLALGPGIGGWEPLMLHMIVWDATDVYRAAF